jgi:ribonuclease-3
LQDYLIRNPSQQGEEGRTTLASTAEALIGAVWIDSEKNFVVTRRAVKKLGLFRTP